MQNEDYKEMLRILLKEEVRFIVVGAHALGVHGFPRATGDIDIWIEPTPFNAKKVIRSLTRFGVPFFDLNNDFRKIKFAGRVLSSFLKFDQKRRGMLFRASPSSGQELAALISRRHGHWQPTSSVQ